MIGNAQHKKMFFIHVNIPANLSGISIKFFFTSARIYFGSQYFLTFIYIFLVADWSIFIRVFARHKKVGCSDDIIPYFKIWFPVLNKHFSCFNGNFALLIRIITYCSLACLVPTVKIEYEITITRCFETSMFLG